VEDLACLTVDNYSVVVNVDDGDLASVESFSRAYKAMEAAGK
jgi:hypothetical protein